MKEGLTLEVLFLAKEMVCEMELRTDLDELSEMNLSRPPVLGSCESFNCTS